MLQDLGVEASRGGHFVSATAAAATAKTARRHEARKRRFIFFNFLLQEKASTYSSTETRSHIFSSGKGFSTKRKQNIIHTSIYRLKSTAVHVLLVNIYWQRDYCVCIRTHKNIHHPQPIRLQAGTKSAFVCSGVVFALLLFVFPPGRRVSGCAHASIRGRFRRG